MLRLFAFYITGFLAPVVSATAQQRPNLSIRFVNYVNGQPLVTDSGYTNVHHENFTIHLLKYYISNITLHTTSHTIYQEKNSYHLTDDADSSSKKILLNLPPGSYDTISFLIGVDSLKNVSGAQTGALDPLNSMFWTWNSGYIMLKMEGVSPQSSALNNKIEYHIGGFSGAFNSLKKITFVLPDGGVVLNDKGITEIIVRFNVDKIWKDNIDLKIAETPVCTTPGKLASSIAGNYSNAFEIIKISQHKAAL